MLRFRGRVIDLGWPRLCGVVNLTPDSFSDGGKLGDVAGAVAFALRLVDEGAVLVDIGGESTRPGARAVGAREEIARVVPVIAEVARRVAGRAVVSVDTTKAEVAAAAVAAGAEVVNDVAGGGFDPGMTDVLVRTGAAFVCGHVRGATLEEVHAASPASFDEVAAELAVRLAALPEIVRRRTIVDPGIGFGKHGPQNLELLGRAGELARRTGCPVMVGPSRKRFLGELLARDGVAPPPAERDAGTVGAALAAVNAGAHVVRVHDVRSAHEALVAFLAVREAGDAGRSRRPEPLDPLDPLDPRDPRDPLEKTT